MSRRAKLIVLMTCLLSGTAMAETVVPLSIGDSQERFAVADDFVRLSEKLPTAFAMEAAVQPKTNRLVEGFVSLSDAKRIALGQPREQTLFEVAVMRDTAALDFTEADWAKARPIIAKGLGQLDLKTLADGDQASANQRMSDTIGHPVNLRFGPVGKPVIYGTDSDSIRFVVLVKIANGKSDPIEFETAGAMTRVGKRLVLMYANRPHVEGGDTYSVRAALDAFVDRALALNQEPAASAPAVRRTGCLGQQNPAGVYSASATQPDRAPCTELPAALGVDTIPVLGGDSIPTHEVNGRSASGSGVYCETNKKCTTPPVFISGSAPAYPEAALKADLSGYAAIVFSISANGDVSDARVESSTSPEFAQAALEAVGKWKYKPATLNGKPAKTLPGLATFPFSPY